MTVHKGVKYGVSRVEAIPGPLDGQVVAGRVASSGINTWGVLSATAYPIEWVRLKADANNTGTVSVTGIGGAAVGFPLAKGEEVYIDTDDLANLALYFSAAGDYCYYLAIRQERPQ